MDKKDPTCSIKGDAKALQGRAKSMKITFQKLSQMFCRVGLVSRKGPEDEKDDVIDETFSLKKSFQALVALWNKELCRNI
eukprot:2418635-Ditylum_brightwellii.AAC.1